MVCQQASDIDHFILDVFEEHEEQFIFPLRSQNQARAFTKALHGKGVPYELLCDEIKELHQNFNAWRKGLGRTGIGSRVLTRINKPLEDVLDSDSDDESGQQKSGSAVNAECEGKIGLEIAADAQRMTQHAPTDNCEERGDDVSVTSASLATQDTLSKSVEDVPAVDSDIDTGSPEVTQNGSGNVISSESSSSPSSPASDTDIPGMQTISSKSKQAQIASSKLSKIRSKMAAMEQHINNVFERKFKKKTSSRKDDGNKVAQDSPTTSEPPQQNTSPQKDILSRESAMRAINNNDKNFSRSSTVEEPSLDVLLREDGHGLARGDQDEKRRSVRERISQFNELHSIRPEATPPLSRSSSMRSLRKSVSPNHATDKVPGDIDDVEAFPRVSQYLELFQGSKSPSPAKEIPSESQERGKKAPKANGRLHHHEKSLKSDARRSGGDSSRDLSLQDAEDEFTLLISELENNNSLPATPGNTQKDMTPESDVWVSFRNSSTDSRNKETSGATEGLDADSESSDDSSKFSTASEMDSQDEDDFENDAPENYDSDLDPECNAKSDHFSQLLTQMTIHKGKLADGPGYIYIFPDSPEGSSTHRMLIGASRNPERRLKQAKVYNMDMWCKDTIFVKSRRTALQNVCQRLTTYRLYKNSDYWFQGDLDSVLQCITSAVNQS